MKNIIIVALIVIAILVGGYFLIPSSSFNVDLNQDENTTTEQTTQGEENTLDTGDVKQNEIESILGKSAGGRDIPVFQYGDGLTEILFIGGIHGGYAWNTSELAYEVMEYFKTNPEAIPDNVKVTIIPVLNPDGLDKVLGENNLSEVASNPPALANTIPGRFNGNDVDLNRNFDCDWKSKGVWQSKTVSGGSEVFSEPEAQAIKNYIENENPTAVIVWYSSAGGVFSSSCHNGISSETKALTNAYADASNYPSYEEFSSYEVTGDMVNWLAKINIPAISVLLTDHSNTEFTKNKAGIEAILNHYAE